MHVNFKVIGLTRLEIELESTTTEEDALTTWPSELISTNQKIIKTQNSIILLISSINNDKKCLYCSNLVVFLRISR